MLSEVGIWLGGAVLLLILYVIISNTLWLLFGSRIIQCLPGVNIRGFRGTLKIATMLVLALIGTISWIIKYSVTTVTRNRSCPNLRNEVTLSIRKGARFINRRSPN
jgi:hypothetical protein